MAGRKEDTLLAVDRVLGTLAQYAVGDTTGDAAGNAGLVDRLLTWEGQKHVSRSLRNAARPWLAGFVRELGPREARLLLAWLGEASANLEDRTS